MTDTVEPADETPVLVVVHGGAPEPDELAALVVAMGTVAPTAAEARPVSGWADRRALLRRPLEHGPGRWAASARPL